MQKLTVVTAAIAAGVMTFAFSAAECRATEPEGRPGLRRRTRQNRHDESEATKAKKDKPPRKCEKAAVAKARKVDGQEAYEARQEDRRPDDNGVDRPEHTRRRRRQRRPRGGQYSAIIARYAASYGVPVSLAKAVIKIESNYRPNMVGSAGEIGLMQIKPATARMMGYSGSAKGLFDPDTNIKYGMKYLAMAQDLGGGTTCGTILKYNAGHAATRMNPVSAAYCGKVKVQMARIGTSVPA